MARSMLALTLGAVLALGRIAAAPASETDTRVVVVERAVGAVQIIDAVAHRPVARVNGLGDLSHATVVFSLDGSHAFVFGRDGSLSKVDLAAGTVAKRIQQAGNSIGGALSADGELIAVANYTPGGVKVFKAATLEEVAEIPATYGSDGARSKVVGLVAASSRRFVFSLYDAGEIWIADLSDPEHPAVRKFAGIGRLPYDGNITADGRFYLAGLFGEDGVALLDLAGIDRGVRRILDGYGHGDAPLPVYKMPHLEGWGTAGNLLMLPAVGRHELIVVDTRDWREAGRIPMHGQPVFAVASPDARRVWVNFAHPLNDVVQIVDVATQTVIATLEPGKAVMHIEFSRDGSEAWVSARDSDRVVVYDALTFERRAEIQAESPSGIFMVTRGRRVGG